MRNVEWCAAAILLVFVIAASDARAQQSPSETPAAQGTVAPATSQTGGSSTPAEQPKPQDAAKTPIPPIPAVHRFWDTENDILFGAVGFGRALDYASTLNLRSRGINEAFLTNEIVDNHPLFATIEVAATGASIGLSYLFHRTHHHRLERLTSVVHAGIAIGGAIRNYNLKSP